MGALNIGTKSLLPPPVWSCQMEMELYSFHKIQETNGLGKINFFFKYFQVRDYFNDKIKTFRNTKDSNIIDIFTDMDKTKRNKKVV